MKSLNLVKWCFVGVVALLFTLAFLWSVMCCDDGDSSKRVFRRSILQNVKILLEKYAADHDGVFSQPDQFTEIYTFYGYSWPDPIFGEHQDDIWMCTIPWEDARVPQETALDELGRLPMLHERVSIDPDGTFVIFWDGTIRWLNNEEFTDYINIEDSICLGCQGIDVIMREQSP